MAKNAKTHQFRAETRKVLNILTHSLYTNREIFLRELLSNASDALEKLRFLQNTGVSPRDGELPLEIRITLDKDNGVLTIADTGVGMSAQEMADNLGTIAKSGSEQFLKETLGKDPLAAPAAGDDDDDADDAEIMERDEASQIASQDASQIIGRFGIGFYSVFMVADKVEVTSVPAQGDEPPHVWASAGEGSYTLRALSAEDGDDVSGLTRGTVIKAWLKDNAKEFLEKYRLESIIRGHSNFLGFPILLEGERVNTTPALWREPKFSISKEQYDEFYKFLTYDSQPPLDVIHLAVDAPVQFNALMFIPATSSDYFNEQKDEWGLDLYVRRVLIERGNRETVPNYLAFLKGVVDTEDLPLNISRETLQENVVLRKISQTIVRQVLGHLERMAETDKPRYEEFWRQHGKYFKFAFNDYVHRDRVAPLMRFLSSATEGDGLTSLDDYLARAKAEQKEIWYVTAPSREAAKLNPHLERFRRKGLEVLYLLEAVDEFALEGLREYKGHAFKSVEQADSKALDAFDDAAGAAPKPADLSEAELADFDALVAAMREILGDQVADIRVSERLTGSPACLASPDGVTSSMEKLMRVMQKSDGIPKKILEINRDHPLMRSLLRIHKADAKDPLIPDIVHTLFDNTLLIDGYLNDPYQMADRTLKLAEEAAAWYADVRKL